MALVHLRVISPRELSAQAQALLVACPGTVAVTAAPIGETAPDLDAVQCDVARESVNELLVALGELGVTENGMITLEPVETAIGRLARKAEDDAPGEGDDALIWDELVARTGSDSTVTATFLAFMVLATVLAGVGVATDSTITVVGACVVGPEFGPLAGLAVGLVRRRPGIVRRALAALLIGFPVAIVLTALLALAAKGGGLIHASDLGGARETEFIYHPGWFSLITALVAGAAGMLSLTSSKSAALVGVFISVTTIPAAGNAAVAAVLGHWYETGQSMLQLLINMVGITVAGAVTLGLRSGRGRRDLVAHPLPGR